MFLSVRLCKVSGFLNTELRTHSLQIISPRASRQMLGPAGAEKVYSPVGTRVLTLSTMLATVAFFNESRRACLSPAPCCFCIFLSRTIQETHAATDASAMCTDTPSQIVARNVFSPASSWASKCRRDYRMCNKAAIQMFRLTLSIWSARENRVHSKLNKHSNDSVIGTLCCSCFGFVENGVKHIL